MLHPSNCTKLIDNEISQYLWTSPTKITLIICNHILYLKKKCKLNVIKIISNTFMSNYSNTLDK